MTGSGRWTICAVAMCVPLVVTLAAARVLRILDFYYFNLNITATVK